MFLSAGNRYRAVTESLEPALTLLGLQRQSCWDQWSPGSRSVPGTFARRTQCHECESCHESDQCNWSTIANEPPSQPHAFFAPVIRRHSRHRAWRCWPGGHSTWSLRRSFSRARPWGRQVRPLRVRSRRILQRQIEHSCTVQFERDGVNSL